MPIDLDHDDAARDWIKADPVDVRRLARAGVPQGEIVMRVAVAHQWSIGDATRYVVEFTGGSATVPDTPDEARHGEEPSASA